MSSAGGVGVLLATGGSIALLSVQMHLICSCLVLLN